MTKQEQIIRALHSCLLEIAEENKFMIYRNRVVNLELPNESKIIDIQDGKTEVIDTSLSPKVETIEYTIPVSISIKKESEEQDIDLELDEILTITQNQIKLDEDLELLYRTLNLTYPSIDIEEDEGEGYLFKIASFNSVVVFDKK